jgi:hypothetical protein
MSGILSKPSMPAPQPVPVNPVNDPAAEKSRLDASQRKATRREKTD